LLLLSRLMSVHTVFKSGTDSTARSRHFLSEDGISDSTVCQ
jgi:hypothetical protein